VTGSNTFRVSTNDGFGQSITGNISPVVYSPAANNTPTVPANSTGSSSTT
jgi:hypothetical protein